MMADEGKALDGNLVEDNLPTDRPHLSALQTMGWKKWLLLLILVPFAFLGIAASLLNTSIGKRYLADRLAEYSPASGLKIKIGRIEGDVFGRAQLHHLTLSDPKGVFLTIPEAKLNWLPHNFLFNELDIRSLEAKRGNILRRPELRLTDPDTPLLPDFDIRIDAVNLENFTLSPKVVGAGGQELSFKGSATIRDGLAYILAKGNVGNSDSFNLLLDAAPDDNRFDLKLDYHAPKEGAIAYLLGAKETYDAHISGAGAWKNWQGAYRITRAGQNFAAGSLKNIEGQYQTLGLITPEGAVRGLIGKALGAQASIFASGTISDGRLVKGKFQVVSPALVLASEGGVDLKGEGAKDLVINAQLKDPAIFGDAPLLKGAKLVAWLNGPWGNLEAEHRLKIDELVLGKTAISTIAQQGKARREGRVWHIPLDASFARALTGNTFADSKLAGGKLGGDLMLTGLDVASDNLLLTLPDLNGRLALRGNLGAGNFGLAGPLTIKRYTVENVGLADASAALRLSLARGGLWSLSGNIDAKIAALKNSAIAKYAGSNLSLSGAVKAGSSAPLSFQNAALKSARLNAAFSGSWEKDWPRAAGTGKHADYGAFTFDAAKGADGPGVNLHFDEPLPAADLRDMDLKIRPSAAGYFIHASGQSALGPFDGKLEYAQDARGRGAGLGRETLRLDDFRITNTRLSGLLQLVSGGVDGVLALSGGGLSGALALKPGQGGGLGIAADLKAENAAFGGSLGLKIARGEVDGRAFIPRTGFASAGTLLKGNMLGEGVTIGQLFLGRLALDANMLGGKGDLTGSLAGRRGSRFGAQFNAAIAEGSASISARGEYAGRPIRIPKPAMLTIGAGNKFALAPTLISYDKGAMVVSGDYSPAGSAMNVKMQNMPLGLIDLAYRDVGLGGSVSGIAEYSHKAGSAPVGSARVQVTSLTRSGLALTSRPLDFALNARLTKDQASAFMIAREAGKERGSLSARISGLPARGTLKDRIMSSPISAQMRFGGPADSLWRMLAINGLDITGPIGVVANVRGSLAVPKVSGSVAGKNLRVQSQISGLDFKSVNMRGSFAESRFRLANFSGQSGKGGSVSGSGIIDLSNLANRGPRLDIRLAAKQARLVNAGGLDATVSGPLRIISDGQLGTIAGRLNVDSASWKLGQADERRAIVPIKTTEINLPADWLPPRAPSVTWRYLIDAAGSRRIDVKGLGLDSEWGANLRIRGTTSDPRIGGIATMVDGEYSFSGTKFELERGRILFDVDREIDPRLDILARSKEDTLDVAVQVQGSALRPDVRFSSTPSLPEEEVLARLLFGGSITQLSATDALQLGTALTSLRGGTDLDPLNRLRSAIGLDRLRIVSADPALGRSTGLALGKKLGRRAYVELVTDGRGYSATSLEFRVTRWLALLASVSTVGRESLVAEVSKDY